MSSASTSCPDLCCTSCHDLLAVCWSSASSSCNCSHVMSCSGVVDSVNRPRRSAIAQLVIRSLYWRRSAIPQLEYIYIYMYMYVCMFLCVCVFHVAAVSAPVVARCLSQHFGSPYHIMFFCSCLGSPCSCFGSCCCMCVCCSHFGSLPQLSRPTAAFSAPCQHCLVCCSRFDSHVHGMPCFALLSRLGRIGFVEHVMSQPCVSIMGLGRRLNWNWTTHAAVGGHCVFCLHVMSWLVLHVMSRLVAMCWSSASSSCN